MLSNYIVFSFEKHQYNTPIQTCNLRSLNIAKYITHEVGHLINIELRVRASPKTSGGLLWQFYRVDIAQGASICSLASLLGTLRPA